ncbi:PhoD-like phosphatase-domain-containing protein [Catenaria anguillulae PL171]|uniref:PhoD-like phosphatase-domain-containing protein n=1 Tax=Catenaria anguillulae PL171 TaxID=765915 RepID=A0A1Y2HEP8_9FUNG|nr:PhoD-like phosphatase-domain-containing protein [Catenaria anguillulae PL171]
MLALTRAPFWQLTQYHYMLFGASMVLLLIRGVLRALHVRSKRGSGAIRSVALTTIAGMLALSALFALVMHQTYDTLLNSFADLRAVRLAGATMDSAKVFVRDPTAKSVTATWQGPNGAQQTATANVSPDTDFVAVVTLTGLDVTGAVTATIKNDKGEVVPGGDKVQVKPLPKQGPFRMAWGSCALPYPYGRGQPGYQNVAALKPDVFMHLGDYIYADLPFIVGDSVENYRRLYRRNWSDKYYMEVASKAPSFHTLDDHEIIDNWEFLATRSPFSSAMRVYDEHVHAGMPLPPNSPKDRYFFNVTMGGNLAAMYVTNGRVYRNPGVVAKNEDGTNKEDPKATYLGADQLADLKKWLLDSHQRGIVWKIIASSVPFTEDYKDRDTWFGFRRERKELLDFMNDNNITNVHVVSGDRHEVGLFKIPRGGGSGAAAAPMFDLSVSPISAFYEDLDSVADTSNLVFKAAGASSYVGAMDISDKELAVQVVMYGGSVVHKFSIPRV